MASSNHNQQDDQRSTRGNEHFDLPASHRLTPELRAWAASDELPEEEIVARVKEIKENGGLELHQFVHELEQVIERDRPNERDGLAS